MNILLIDNDQEILDSVGEALELIGFPTRTFSSPQDAIDAYISEGFDVVITDIRMPEMSGIEVLKAIRAYNPSAKVICYTGYSEDKNYCILN